MWTRSTSPNRRWLAARRVQRRGLAVPEWFVLLGLVGVGLFAAVGLLGDMTRQQIEDEVTGPNSILGQQAAAARRGAGNDSSSSSQPGGGSSAPDSKPGASKPHGNNGLGNGEDPAPPGNPPENDGAGTSPGNPGNKGGPKKK
jgi:hypothetical protein